LTKLQPAIQQLTYWSTLYVDNSWLLPCVLVFTEFDDDHRKPELMQ